MLARYFGRLWVGMLRIELEIVVNASRRVHRTQIPIVQLFQLIILQIRPRYSIPSSAVAQRYPRCLVATTNFKQLAKPEGKVTSQIVKKVKRDIEIQRKEKLNQSQELLIPEECLESIQFPRTERRMMHVKRIINSASQTTAGPIHPYAALVSTVNVHSLPR